MKNFAKLLCIITVFSYGYAQQVHQKDASVISFDRILIKEKNVAKLLAHRANYRKVFTTVKVLVSAYGLASGVAGILDFFGLRFNEPSVKLSDVEVLLQKNTQSFQQRLLQSAGQAVVSTAAHLGFYYIFSKAEEQYGPTADIRWFVTIKNPFYTTLRQLYFLAQEVPLTKKPQELHQEMEQLFSTLIDQTENIIAFMQHKKELFPQERKVKAEQVIQHFIGRVESIYADFARALHTDAYNVTFHLDSVLMLLEGECARFAATEKSSWINPSVILGMMQSIS